MATTTTAPPGRTRATASSSDDCVPAASTTAPYSSARPVPAPRSSPPARCWGWRATRSTSRPRAPSAATVARPIEPPPITSTRSPGSTSTAARGVASRPPTAPPARRSWDRRPARSGTRQLSVDDHLVGQAAVDRHAVQPVGADAAQLRLAGEAAVALAAPRIGLHRHRGAVVEHARELVAEGHGQVPRGEVQVGRADPARAHAHQHRIGRRAPARVGSTSTTATPPSPDARTARIGRVLQGRRPRSSGA